jgi:hypothetical protein
MRTTRLEISLAVLPMTLISEKVRFQRLWQSVDYWKHRFLLSMLGRAVAWPYV